MADKDFVVKNGLVVNTNLIVANGTSNRVGINNSTPDASLTVTGTANISGNVSLTGANVDVNSYTTFFANVHVQNTAVIDTRLYVGNTTNMVPLGGLPIIQAVDTRNSFVMISSQNLSKEDDACADLLIYADNTGGLNHFNDLGINNSRFDGTLHRISANTNSDSFILGETLYQSNGTVNVAVGILRDRTVINSTSRSLKISILETDGIVSAVGSADFSNTVGANLSIRGVTSGANADILVAVPFGVVSDYSVRNYPFTIGKRGDGYLYNANSALTIGTTAGGLRVDVQTISTSFINGANQIVLTSGDTTNIHADLILAGTNIPVGTYITSVINSTAFKISSATTGSSSGSYTLTDPFYDAAGNPIVFHVNGMSANDEVARISGNGNLTIGNNSTSRSDKLTVRGTANITGNVAIANNMTVAGNVVASGNVSSPVFKSGANVVVNTTTMFIGNSTANATQISSLIQVSNSTSTANMTAADLKIGGTVVNSSIVNVTLVTGNIAGGYANITGQVNTATLYAATSANIASAVQANSTGVWTTGQVNAASHTTGAGFGGATPGATVNATTIAVSSNTTVNSTHTSALVQVSNSTSTANLTAADLKIGGTVVNNSTVNVTLVTGNIAGGYANISGQVNTATLYATTSANIASVVQANSTGVWVASGNIYLGSVSNSVSVNTTLISLGNTSVNASINSTIYTGTSNNTLFVGSTSAVNVVSNTQLQSNLALYQTLAGLAANVAKLDANNTTYLNGQLASYYTTATNMSSGTLPSGRLSGSYTGITAVGTLSTLAVTGNASINNFSITSNASQNVVTIVSSNVDIDSGVLFVDSVSNRVGINTTTPDASLQVVGNANVVGNFAVTGNFNVAGALTYTGTAVSTGDFIPDTGAQRNLGSASARWNLIGNVANLGVIVNAPVANLSANLNIGSNVLVNTSSIYVGNQTVYTLANSTYIDTSGSLNVNSQITANALIRIGAGASNSTLNAIALAFANATATATLNATAYSGTANNATNFSGQPASYYTNADNISTGTINSARLPQGSSSTIGALQVVDSVTNTNVLVAASANSVKSAYERASTMAATAYSNGVTYTDTKAATAYSNGVTYTDTKAATAYSNAVTYADTKAATAYTNAVNYVTAQSYANTSQLTSNAATAYTNAVNYVTAQSYANTSQLTSNAATAYTNAVNYVTAQSYANTSQLTSNAATAYTNATTFASNATNITSGTLAYSVIPANIINTTASFTITGQRTYSANISTTANINFSNSTASAVIFANTSNVYFTGIAYNANNSTTVGGNTAATLRAYTDTVGASTLTSAQDYSSVADNLTSGTVPYARIPTNIVNTTAAFTISGVHGHTANVNFTGGANVYFSNGSAAAIIFANTSNVYFTGIAYNANNSTTVGGNTAATLRAYTDAAQAAAQLYATDAGNISTGVLAESVLPRFIVNTTAAYTLSGVHTYTANIVTSANILFSNTAATKAVLFANTTNAYFTGIALTAVNANNTAYVGSTAASAVVNTSQLSAFGYVNSSVGTAFNSSNLAGVAATNYARTDTNETFAGTITSLSHYITTTGGVERQIMFQMTDRNVYFYAQDTGNKIVGLYESPTVGTSFNRWYTNSAGALVVQNDVTAFASDERIKTNIKIIPDALDKVNKIRGVQYNFNELGKSFGFNDKETHVGVIAQEIEKVLPEVIQLAPFDRDMNDETKSKSGENYKTVKYDKIVALLIEAIKELNEKVDSLTNEIAELKK